MTDHVLGEEAPRSATSSLSPFHWREYLIEGALLFVFMISACLVTAAVEHPASPLRQAIPSAVLRRALVGIGMGLTAISLIYSRWGRRSGAHFNPAVTLTFLRLGKVEPRDAVFYVVAQFAGAIAGVLAATALLGGAIRDPAVRYVATIPGPRGSGVAFAAEFAISFILMSVVLRASNDSRLARFTGLFAGLLVATYITIEAPLSGMSMNPARTLGSAAVGRLWMSLWIYFSAPLAGMLLAAEAYRRTRRPVLCAKLHHPSTGPCLFRCGYAAARRTVTPPALATSSGTAGRQPEPRAVLGD